MKREEALNEIRSWAIPSKKGREVLETLIPELAESEDEKVRKEIIEVLQFVPSSMWEQAKTDYERCFAYLEKQKYDKMQPIYDNQESFESALDKAWKSYNDSGARTVDGCEDNYTECAHAKGFREGYLFGLEKQKEQKSIEIDKEINRWMGCEAFPEGTNITPLPQAMEIVERTAKHFFELGEKTVPSPGGYWEGFNAGVRECQAKSRDAKGAMKEQEPELYYDKELDNAAREFYLSGGAVSPIDSTGLVPIVRMAEFGATWMKERMEKEQKPINLDLDTLVIELEETIGTSPHSRETIKEFFLKATQKYVNALRKTNKEIGELIEENFYLKEQQPAEWSDYKDKVNVPYCSSEPEWSEEDEKQIRQIERIVKNAGCTKMLQEKIHNWFESLRPQPHWKPSEEQMDSLERAIILLEKQGHFVEVDILKSIQRNLKKL